MLQAKTGSNPKIKEVNEWVDKSTSTPGILPSHRKEQPAATRQQDEAQRLRAKKPDPAPISCGSVCVHGISRKGETRETESPPVIAWGRGGKQAATRRHTEGASRGDGSSKTGCW